MGWLVGAAPRERRGEMIGSAMGAAIAGALLGPVIGVAADLLGTRSCSAPSPCVGVGLMVWALRTPAAKPPRRRRCAGVLAALCDAASRPGCGW